MGIDKSKMKLSDEKLNKLSGGQLYVTQDKYIIKPYEEYSRYSLVGKDKSGNSYNMNGMTKEQISEMREKLKENFKFIDTEEF